MLDLLVNLVIAALGGVALSIVVATLIDASMVRTEVQKNVPNAFKAIILSKTTKTVNVGIFSENNELINNMEIESEKGVDVALKKDQIIYI